VWSVGAKKIEVYLAAGLALFKEPSRPLISLSHAPTLPMQAVLAQLQALALEQGISLRNRAINVCLSARYAPGCALPLQVNGNKGAPTEAEQHRFVSATLNIPSNNLRVQIDVNSSNFAAAITHGQMKALEDWTLSNGARLQGVQPLWSVVTQAHRAQPASVKAVVLIEPDGMSLLAQLGSNASANLGKIFERAANADTGGVQLQINRWQDKFQLMPQEMLTLSFRETEAFRSEPGVSQWPGHWEAA
jgi:hypothetical protein